MNRAAGSEITFWKVGILLLLAGALAACGKNTTSIGIFVSAPGVASGSTATIITNGTLQFTASVTGISTTTVYWRICLPAASVSIQPTNCTAIPGVTASSAASLSGYGSISQTGLYTAPPTPPAPNSFVIMAISTVSTHILDTTGTVNADFGVLSAKVDTGVRVQVFPTTSTIGTGETLQLTATVTGTTNQGVSWSVNGIAGGNSAVGLISPSGVYTAPSTVPTAGVTITAASSADPSQTGIGTITVSNVADATLTSIDPVVALQGAAQQNVYLTGSNFFTTDTVYVAPPSQAAAAVPTTFISTTLLRATIPSNLLTQAGQDQISVLRQNLSPNSPGPAALTVNPTRPAIVAATPDSVSQTGTGTVSIALTGGFFASPATTATFNGASVAPSITSSRQLSVTTTATALAPGLYPLFVQNSGVPATQSSMAAINVAVTPSPFNIPTALVGSSVSVGASPDAIAIDYALGIAVVANNGGNSVSFIKNLATSPAVFASVGVGHGPTGVAVDDSLHLAFVVNSTDQTISTINLNLPTPVVTSTISVAIGPTAGSASGPAPVPYSVGVNPLTHHAIVAYESFNEATVLDVSSGTPHVLQQIGGDITAPIGTGTTPAISVDERLNWAVVTPGGGGAQTTTMVDLGSNASAITGARSPQVIASLALSTQGVGINSETHQALFTNPSAGNLASFSLLDNSVNSINFTNNGIAFDQLGLTAAAADPLENIGIAVNSVSGTAVIVDLENGNVLLTVFLPANSSPQAIAVDPGANRAFVVNQGNNSVSVLSLGSAINPIQIVESNPAITSTSSSNLTLTLNGNFPASSVVRLDQTALTTSSCAGGCRQLTATVPASMLVAARNYAVDVLSAGAVSNVTYLTVVQPITVGNSPVGVAVDTDRDLAIVTNAGSGSVSLVALSPTTPVGISQHAAGAVGTIGAPLTVGSNPLGVAVLPRLGLAVVANSGSNNVSLVDVTQAFVPQTTSLCASGGFCTGPTAVAINPDTAAAIVTNAGILNDTAAPSSLSFATITPAASATVPSLGSSSSTQNVDQNPVSVAIDPSPSALNPGLSYAAVGTASTASSVEVFNLFTQVPQRISFFENPTGLIFDPLNQQFIVANSLSNNIVIVDPVTLIQTPIRVGINPTALAYDYQASTLVTSNLASHTLSILDFVCSPASGGASCLNPQVQAVLPLGGSQQFSVAVDPNLNLAVVVDQANNQVLLVPLLH